jgi:hypothetical protein
MGESLEGILSLLKRSAPKIARVRCARAALSSMAASASSRFSRVFSSSSIFNRSASETSIPPNFAFHL